MFFICFLKLKKNIIFLFILAYDIYKKSIMFFCEYIKNKNMGGKLPKK